jgi:DNA-binding PadR family transcriptional regulator
MTRKPSHATKLVFQAFLDAPSDESYGFALAEATGLPSGTIYPILQRLQKEGFIESRWAEVATMAQRRHRRYHKLTGEGRRVAQEATAKERQALRMLAPGWAAAWLM